MISVYFVFVVVGANVYRECREFGHGELIVTCPPEEFIRINSVDVFSVDADIDRERCEQTSPTCTVEGDLLRDLMMLCNEQRYCTVEVQQLHFQNIQCVQHDTTNVVRVTYNCSKGK